MIENGRVNAAYQFCERQKKNNSYYIRIKNMPMMIKTNGMAAAIAFLFSKQRDEKRRLTPYGQLYYDIQNWLLEKKFIEEGENKKPQDVLMEQLTSMESEQYRLITIETMALLGWMKRFGEVLCKGDENGEEKDG